MSLTQHADRGAWLAARRAGIGGSDVAAILGVNRYRSALEVWAEKCGYEIPREESEAAGHGHGLEGYVLAELAAASGVAIDRLENVTRRHPSVEWAFYSPDGAAWDDCACEGVLPEAKTVGGWASLDWEDGIPAYYWPQVQHGLWVTGLWRALVGVLRGGPYAINFRWSWVERDPRYVEECVPALARFWRSVVDREPPAPDGSDSAAKAIKAMFPESIREEPIELPGALADEAAEHDALKAEMAALDQRAREINNRARLALGEHARGLFADGSGWTWTKGRKQFKRLEAKEESSL